MRETLKSRLAKLEMRIHPKPPALDLVKLIQEISAEHERLLTLSKEDFDAIAANNDLPHDSVTRSAVHSILEDRKVAEYCARYPSTLIIPERSDTEKAQDLAHDEQVFAKYVAHLKEMQGQTR